ncbi:MAG: hypothetical protein ACRDZY_18360, partial [Acidimicrobiales bacterium]
LDMRLGGTSVPGLTAGNYGSDEGSSFWAVGSGRRGVVLELRGEGFDYVVVEVADPEATVAMLRSALFGPGRAGGERREAQ